MPHFVVIGAGQAGASLVGKLRKLGFDGEITLIGEEPEPPYQRPPLSKAYLTGEMAKERLFLHPEQYYDDQNITLRLETKVDRIDPDRKEVHLADEVIGYDQLALTTGSSAITLPDQIGGGLENVYTVRSLQDVDQMSENFAPGKKVLVVGGGYIGLEAAAVATKLGLEVTLVEMAERILKRVASPETSDYFRSLHTGKGVNIREGVGLTRLIGDGKVAGAELSDGEALSIDFVIVGVGIRPCTQLAEEAGLEIDNGIKTDTHGRSSDPSIWAAGDCASFPWRGARIRLESVPNAIDQAEMVAENMLGGTGDYDPHPWFWSDQYDTKLQIAGLNTGYDRVVTRIGEREGALSFWYYSGSRLVAVDAVNDPRSYMVGKRLIEAGKSPDASLIEAPETDLKALLKL